MRISHHPITCCGSLHPFSTIAGLWWELVVRVLDFKPHVCTVVRLTNKGMIGVNVIAQVVVLADEHLILADDVCILAGKVLEVDFLLRLA